MTYNGYFNFGDIEIIDVARTEAYVQAIAPAIGLSNCAACPDLGRVLGHWLELGPDERKEVLSVDTNYHRSPRAVLGAAGFATYTPGTEPIASTALFTSTGASSVLTRTNRIQNPNPPAAGGAAGWTLQSGTGETSTLSYVTGATDGPSAAVTNYQRRTITAAKTTGASGQYYSSPSGAVAGSSGDRAVGAMWVRFSHAVTIDVNASFRSGLTVVGQAASTVTIPANTWYLAMGVPVATATYNVVQVSALLQSSSIIPVGGWMDAAVAHWENAATWDGEPFWGEMGTLDRAGDVRLTHGWTGSARNTASTRSVGFSPGANMGGLTSFARQVIATEKTAGASGWSTEGSAARSQMSGAVGDPFMLVSRQRWTGPGGPQTFTPRVVLLDGAGVAVHTLDLAPITVTSGEVREIAVSGVSPVAFTYAAIWNYQASAERMPAGSVLDLTGLMALKSLDPVGFFDGATSDTIEEDYAWAGTANASISTKTVYAIGPSVISDTRYTDPRTDNAPWFDPGRRASEDFLGMYPLRVDGIDDSTREAKPIDLIGDGGTMTRSRRGARELRFETVLLATTEEGLDAGLTWLESALDSYRCADPLATACSGTDLEFFSSCPEVEIVTPTSVVYNWDGTSPATEAALWTGHGGGVFNAAGTIGFASTQGAYVERQITGLVSGEWYLVSLTMPGHGRVTVDVSGTALRFPSVTPEMNAATYTFQMEFLARSSSETLQIIGTAPGAMLASAIPITGLRIERTVPGTIIRQSGFAVSDGPKSAFRPYGVEDVASGPFNALSANTYTEATQSTTDRAVYVNGQSSWRKTRTTVGTSTMPATLQLGVINLGFLDPGTHRVALWMHADRSIASAPAATQYRIGVLETGMTVNSASSTVTSRTSGSAPTKFEITINVPARMEVELRVDTVSNPSFVVAQNDWIDFTPVLLQVIRTQNTVAVPLPDSTVKYWRTLHNVTAFTGPTVLDRYKLTCGFGLRVSFGMSAGDPRKYKRPRQVGRRNLALTRNERTWRCKNGVAYRYNYFSNPTFATDMTGWTATGTTTDPFTWFAASIDNVGAGFGPGRVRGGVGSAGQTLGLRQAVNVTASGWYHVMFSAIGTGPTAGLWNVRVGSAAGLADIADVPVQDGVGNPGPSYADFYINVGWPGPRTVYVEFRLVSTAATVADHWSLDAMLFGDGKYQNGDGWFGGDYYQHPVASASRAPFVYPVAMGPTAWDPNATFLIPDRPGVPVPCLRWPVAPRTPIVDSTCSDLHQEFSMHTEIQIAPGAISTTGKVVPRLRFYVADDFTQFQTSVGAVRVRWYRNPLGRPVSELEQCAFEGEQTLANIPTNAWVTLDGELRTLNALADYPARNVSSYDVDIPQALYGPDMGGVVWPELSCGEQYTLVVDIDTDGEPTGESIILLPSPESYVDIELVPIS